MPVRSGRLGAGREPRFHADADSPTFDPDGRMFELWEAYRGHHRRVVAQLREWIGPVDRAVRVEIERGYSDGEAGYRVRVSCSPTQTGIPTGHLSSTRRPGGWRMSRSRRRTRHCP